MKKTFKRTEFHGERQSGKTTWLFDCIIKDHKLFDHEVTGLFCIVTAMDFHRDELINWIDRELGHVPSNFIFLTKEEHEEPITGIGGIDVTLERLREVGKIFRLFVDDSNYIYDKKFWEEQQETIECPGMYLTVAI